ncbi:MAG: flagellar hook-basal body complex protein [Proteobacteria bacterium]|nr:flagellar hook-basal body complex protein [Pseudomonadota bacterium]
MSLTSSLFAGVSGLTNLGNAMQVIGDNVANVNTVGFKGNRYTFSDLLSQSIATQSGTAQVGRGMALGSIDASYDQGSFESTGNTTDLSIGGDGFFIVSDPNNDRDFYTRAGNFHFDKDGKLVNPEGYIVQGWELDSQTGEDQGSVVDVIMRSFTSPPMKTSEVTVVTNLDSDALTQTEVLSNAWDGLAQDTDPNIDGSNYHYQTVVKVYDSLGSTHDITIYYDKKSDTGSEWEYMIACNPAEDKRNLVQNTVGQGLLARGTILFSDSTGTVLDFTMEKFTGRIGDIKAAGAITNETTTFSILNYDAFPLDGYDFSLEFDGTNWTFQDKAPPVGIITPADLPANYPRAQIISGNMNSIQINIDGDTKDTVDLEITFSIPAQATDALTFDIINPNNVHVQDVTNTRYSGDAANAKTTLSINNPSVLTNDASDVNIIFDASEEEWYWSSPLLQNVMDTNVTGLSVPAATATPLSAQSTVTNPGVMTHYSDNMTVWYNATSGDWEWRSDYARDLTNLSYDGGIASGNVTYSLTDVTQLTEHSTGNQLYWDNIVGVTGLAYGGAATAANTTLTVLQEDNFTMDSSIQYTLNWDGANWNWSGGADPSIDLDYTNRQVPVGDATYVEADLTGDGSDIRFDFAGAGLVGAATVSFRIDSDGQWSWSMPTIDVSSYNGTVVTSTNTEMNILNPSVVTTDSTVIYNLNYTVAAGPTPTWTWGANDPLGAGDYAAANIIPTSNENSVGIDLDGDFVADIEYYFTRPLSTTVGDSGGINFRLDATGSPPAEYSSATIMTGSDQNVLTVDLTGNGNADLTYAFTNPLTSNGAINFDIDTHIPPPEYANAIIDNVNSNNGHIEIDIDGDGFKNIDFDFYDGQASPAPVGVSANSTFTFDIDPRVPPTEYANATIQGDREKVLLDLDGDDKVDITFTFDETTPLMTGVQAPDSGITFDIEGTTAWEQMNVNNSGYFEFGTDFLGGDKGSTVMDIVFNIGTRDDGTGNFVNDSLTTTQYARSSTTTFQSGDGYGAGDLQGVDVASDGVMTGVYSNGELIPLFRVALAKFLNNQGLFKEGGNLFRETRESGRAITNKPGTNGLGSLSPNSLEMSNVDIANEFVKMITTQRGFQANSKIVTTVDTMLEQVINMKR